MKRVGGVRSSDIELSVKSLQCVQRRSDGSRHLNMVLLGWVMLDFAATGALVAAVI